MKNTHITKILNLIEKMPDLFKSEEITYVTGLTKSQITEIKKYIVAEELAVKNAADFAVTEKGREFAQQNPYVSWVCEELPKRPEINLEYLKEEKSPVVSKAIGLLAKHLLLNEVLKENSIEHNIYREILQNEAFNEIAKDINDFIFSNKRIKMTEFFEKFLNAPYGLTKSIATILFLGFISKNKNFIVIYEGPKVHLSLNHIVFDNLVSCQQRYEIQKSVLDDEPLIKEMSGIILEEPSSNTLDLARGVVSIVKSLTRYALNTNNLSSTCVRMRNAFKNAEDPIALFYRDIPRILASKEICNCDSVLVERFEENIKELKNAYEKLLQELTAFVLKSFDCKSREDLRNRLSSIKEYVGAKELVILANNINDETISDRLWIERIAICVNKSLAPEDWADSDVADFKLKFKEFASKFLTIESTAGRSAMKLDKTMSDVLGQLLSLSMPQRVAVLRKAVNG